MKEKFSVIDAEGNQITTGDCVERNGSKYAVLGLMDVCNEDVVVLGESVGETIAAPYCERADWLRKVEI